MRGFLPVAAVLLAVPLAFPLVTKGIAPQWRGQFKPDADSRIRGTVTWREMSESYPLKLHLKGTEPSALLTARVCGLSAFPSGDTIEYYDWCWPVFVDRDAHLTAFSSDERGKANVLLMPKLAVGPTTLLTPGRVEVYTNGEVIATAPLVDRMARRTR